MQLLQFHSALSVYENNGSNIDLKMGTQALTHSVIYG